MNIRPPTQSELRMIFELAYQNSSFQATRDIITNATAYYETTWKKFETPPVPDPNKEIEKSDVEKFGIKSSEAQAKRDKRKETRLAAETAAKILLPWKDYERLSPESILKRCQHSGPAVREKVLTYERSHLDRVQIITTLENWKL